MKLTKKQETDIWQVYDTWLHAYLNGDVVTYNKFLDKDYHFIGSTNNEEFLNKKDTAQFFKATADQLAGKCDLRNETKIIEKFEGLIFVTHLFDAWFKTENDWAYYGRFRFTNTTRALLFHSSAGFLFSKENSVSKYRSHVSGISIYFKPKPSIYLCFEGPSSPTPATNPSPHPPKPLCQKGHPATVAAWDFLVLLSILAGMTCHGCIRDDT